MRVTWDRDNDMAYVYLTRIGPGEAFRQVPLNIEGVADTIILDLDKQGRVLGLEFFQASRILPRSLLETAVAPGADRRR